MKDAYINRDMSTDLGTPGDLSLYDYRCHVLELSWRENLTGKSCTPEGDFLCKWQWSDHFQRDLYHVLGVPGREGVEVHSANWAGNTDMGYKCQLLGCFAPGIAFGDVTIDGYTQWGILKSKVALKALEEILAQEDFMLHVRWKDGAKPAL